MTQKVFSRSAAYQPYSDLNMYQYPISVPGFSIGYDWNEIVSQSQHSGVYNYYPNWYHQKKMSHPRKKKSFTIRDILGLDSSEHESNYCVSSEKLSPPRLSPERLQMPSSKNFGE